MWLAFTFYGFGLQIYRVWVRVRVTVKTAPAVWNSLPKTVLNNDSLAVFKSRLKTFLFSQAFPSFSAH